MLLIRHTCFLTLRTLTLTNKTRLINIDKVNYQHDRSVRNYKSSIRTN